VGITKLGVACQSYRVIGESYCKWHNPKNRVGLAEEADEVEEETVEEEAAEEEADEEEEEAGEAVGEGAGDPPSGHSLTR